MDNVSCAVQHLPAEQGESFQLGLVAELKLNPVLVVLPEAEDAAHWLNAELQRVDESSVKGETALCSQHLHAGDGAFLVP